MTFLDYYKEILEKVSFDHHLLNKEYKKAIAHLEKHEKNHLKDWMAARGFLPASQRTETLSHTDQWPDFHRSKNNTTYS